MPVFPYGACIVAEAAEKAGWNVDFVDLTFQKNHIKAIQEEISLHKPDAVGISLRNIDNNDISKPEVYYKGLAEITRAVKDQCAAPVILGGAAAGVMPRQLLAATGVDWLVSGPGEEALPQLLSHIIQGREPVFSSDRIERNGRIIRANPPSTWDMEPYAPNFWRRLDVIPYTKMNTAAPLQTKKGCPFKCVYCTYNLSEGTSYTLAEPAHVAKAAQFFVEKGFKDIEFVDNVFNSPYEHAVGICSELSKARVNARFLSLELSPAFVDDQLIALMETAGFAGVGITAESASDLVLTGLGKGFTVERVKAAAQVMRRHNVPCCWIFMMGGPGETIDTVRETIEFAATQLGPKDVAFFNVGIRVYPGAPIEKIAREQGVLTVDPDAMLDPAFYVSPGVDLQEMLTEMREAAKSNLHFITGDALPRVLLQQVISLSTALGLKSPLWQYTRSIRRVLRLLRLYP